MRPVKRPPINPPNTYAWKYGPGRTMETYLGYQMLAYVGIILLAEYLFSIPYPLTALCRQLHRAAIAELSGALSFYRDECCARCLAGI